ncbi:uncharacterized zinc finger protein CG2678-like isoform X2 [Drosophila innubila]|uniref:uncharacterized zinc finger protein CG2678-like isoform X2 n=1 Tax=Drosophila innubila TaxID=198719 RepID=UPI00148CF9C6|nr:uncharacterized zinc finger protein CG2678-like isoform X2 [Drosophila innubila]
MDEVCRFCTLNCTTLENIFKRREQTDNEPHLILMLECCTNCEIRESDALPQNICGPCISAAKIAFEFKFSCGQSEKHFKDIVNECTQLEVKYEFDEVCRFCTLNCTTLENIFAERERTDAEPLLSVMLEYCMDCDIRESDSLPQNICGPCISAAKNAFEFKLRCEQSEKYFKDLLSECDQKPEIDELITGDSCLTESALVGDCIKLEPDNFVGCSTTEETNANEDYSGDSEEDLSTEELNDTVDEDEMEISDEHMQQLSGDRPFKCEQCPKAYKDKRGLKQHIVNHSDDRPFKCRHCPKAFKAVKI